MNVYEFEDVLKHVLQFIIQPKVSALSRVTAEIIFLNLIEQYNNLGR